MYSLNCLDFAFAPDPLDTPLRVFPRTWDCLALLALSLVLRTKRSSVEMMSLSWVEMRVASASFWRASLKLMAIGADYAE